MGFFKKLTEFIRNVAGDARIPERDKKVILALLALIVSPLDFIPDWIPIFGLIDDAIMISLVLDYFFNVLDRAIILSHYPWGMKSFVVLQKTARGISVLTPGFIKRRLWQFEGSPYGR